MKTAHMVFTLACVGCALLMVDIHEWPMAGINFAAAAVNYYCWRTT